MKKFSKPCFVILIFILLCTQYVLADEYPVIVPETWKSKKIVDVSGNMNISGDYAILGEAAVGTPTYFMGETQWPLFLDLMSGADIGGPHKDRNNLTRVHIEQKDCTGLELTFFSKEGVIAKKSIAGSEKVTISCDREAFKVIATAVGGTGRTMDEDSSYYLSEDGSLILHSKYAGIDRSRTFFGLFWNHFKYEYLVRFNKVARPDR